MIYNQSDNYNKKKKKYFCKEYQAPERFIHLCTQKWVEWITEEVTEQGELQRGQQWPGAVMEEKLVASPAVCWRPFSGREGWRMKAMNGGPLGHVCTAGGSRCFLRRDCTVYREGKEREIARQRE